jgi:hypothetical protein
MSRSLRIVDAIRCLAFVPGIFIILSGRISLAADAPPAGEVASAPAQVAAESLVELDEVWVRGRNLTRLIEDAEDAFFARYNALNRNDRFDVHCGDVVLSRGSMIMTRTCLPGFIADRMPSGIQVARSGYYQPPTAFGSPTCYGPMTVDGGAAQFEGGCYGAPVDQRYYGGSSYGGSGNAGFSYVGSNYSPPLELEAVHYRQEYADTVIEVIHGDPQLVEMARDLALLYADLELTQQRFRAARRERFEARPPNYGPRVSAPRNR